MHDKKFVYCDIISPRQNKDVILYNKSPSIINIEDKIPMKLWKFMFIPILAIVEMAFWATRGSFKFKVCYIPVNI